MRASFALRLAAGLVFSLASFTALASIIFLAGTGLIEEFQHPFWQWWLYLFEAGGNPVVRHWLLASGIPGASIPLLAGLALLCAAGPSRAGPCAATIRRRTRSRARSAARPTIMATPAG